MGIWIRGPLRLTRGEGVLMGPPNADPEKR